jgi:HTH-type transcriptional regulator/antitoxin HipB
MSSQNLSSMAEIGALVRATRKAQKLSQWKLASLSGTGNRYISDLENGKSTLQIAKLFRVLNTLGLGMYIHSPWDKD